MLPSVTGCEVPCVTRHQLPAMSYRVTLRCNNAFVKHVQIYFYAAANLARGVLLAALTQYALHHGVEAAVYNLGYSCRHHLASGHTATALPPWRIRNTNPNMENQKFLEYHFLPPKYC